MQKCVQTIRIDTEAMRNDSRHDLFTPRNKSSRNTGTAVNYLNQAGNMTKDKRYVDRKRWAGSDTEAVERMRGRTWAKDDK